MKCTCPLPRRRMKSRHHSPRCFPSAEAQPCNVPFMKSDEDTYSGYVNVGGKMNKTEAGVCGFGVAVKCCKLRRG